MSMNVNLDAVKAYRAAQQGGVGVAEMAAAGLDAFGLIFEQMALAMGQNPAAGLEMGEGFLPADGQEKSEETDALMLELAGSLLVQNPQWLAFLEMDDAAAQELVSGLDLPADVQQFLLQSRSVALDSTALSSGVSQEMGAAFPSAEQKAEAVQSSAQSDAAQMGFSKEDAAVLTMRTDAGSAEELPGLSDQFMRSIRAAKDLLEQAGKPQSEETELDIDQLQSDILMNRFQPQSALGNLNRVEFNDTQADAPALDQQIQEGITENLLRGQKEFTIKLRPEGLGEITVKLLEKPGEASVLSLITSSAESAKLINEKLTSLQEAMRPLQVQVNLAVPETVEPSQAGSQPDFHSQQFLFDQQNGQQKSGQRSGRSGSTFRLTDEGLVEEIVAENAEGLDTYI